MAMGFILGQVDGNGLDSTRYSVLRWRNRKGYYARLRGDGHLEICHFYTNDLKRDLHRDLVGRWCQYSGVDPWTNPEWFARGDHSGWTYERILSSLCFF
jgi:hypothetical protein